MDAMKKLTKYIALLAVTLSLTTACSGSDNTSQTEKNNTGSQIVETGELAAVETRSFTFGMLSGNFFALKIIGILEHGSIVEAGDSIIQLDPSNIKKMIIDRESQLETKLAALEKLKVDQRNKQLDLESKIKTEESSFALSKLELESSAFESPRNKKIKQLEFEQAKISLARVKRQLGYSQTIARNELKKSNLDIDLLKKEIKDAYSALPKLTIRTPISGIFQVGKNRRTNTMLKIGDEIYPGQNMGNVPDLTWMKVNTSVSENDFLKVFAGQKVKVRLDALPKVSFDGEVSFVSKLCHPKEEKSKKKVFDVTVRMLKPDERLKPGMTVSCEFLNK